MRGLLTGLAVTLRQLMRRSVTQHYPDVLPQLPPRSRGVIALLVPWNDPVAIACGQIAAALVTGNTVVYKPSEKTPLSGAR